MLTPARVAEAMTALIVGGIVLAVGCRLLTGSINTTGLLHDSATGELSSERVQLLVITLGAVLFAVVGLGGGGLDSSHVTLVPAPYLALLGGSQAFYLWRKFRTLQRMDLG